MTVTYLVIRHHVIGSLIPLMLDLMPVYEI